MENNNWLLGKIQFVFWGKEIHWGYWKYPRTKVYYQTFKKPIFYGLCCGFFEIRYFPIKSGLVNIAKAIIGIPIDEMEDS